MAVFELERLRDAGEAFRGWKRGRFLPLYAAGLLAGVGMVLGMRALAPADALRVVAAPPGEVLSPIKGAEDPTHPSMPFAIEDDAAGAVASLRAVWEPLANAAGGSVERANELRTSLTETSITVAMVVRSVEREAPAESRALEPPQAAPASDPVVASVPTVAPPPPEPEPEPVVQARPNFHVPAVSNAGMSDLEARLFNGINAERAAAGLAPYTYDAGLSVVARTRSQQMVDQGYFGHVDPYGYSMYVELLAHFGYTSYAWAGENLAVNNYGVHESPERAVVSLMNSPSHRSNILQTAFSRVGIGEVTHADGRKFYTIIFLG